MNVVRITIPPLRDRRDDILPLAEHALRRLETRYGWERLALAPETCQAIEARDWPGNVRQLENSLARAAIAARGRAILPEHLDTEEAADPTKALARGEAVPLRALLADVERRAIRLALATCSGNRTRAAERLGISRRQLFEKIREYDLGT